eukprot:CAMPEP_0114347454 /NCGR_PEP_ID=MMETSP0101-20121206/13901_1 /TAXON_ID=38822 ORGANISM="Pteridomonas danica, Strain PT" /NCGR_SAMPLE_ID=MMETSP0101 /ASSEMBLY_ACC=CAM_ASM_000211 /LENGTH=680 /DNA_ID=CAMNT_0001484749 /DNA_START=348 /DNA_END=2390 /DNA_ORIENTATION=-
MLAEPEWVGVYIATYIAFISTLAFCVGLNESCGVRETVAKDTIFVELSDDDSLYRLKHGECDIFSGSTSAGYTHQGTCTSELLDRGSFFEKHVFNWVGQLILYLFAFTSLFKPSFKATIWYTGSVGVIGFLGCWYQGFAFWNDSDRVVASGIGTAIFLFLSAAAVNIFSAHVLHNMERDLVNANYELTANMEKRQKQPAGDHVVYLETDLQSSTKLWEHHTETMHKAIKVHHNLMRSLALEYFGWELATEGDAFLLAFHDVFDAVSFALTFQHELMDQDWEQVLLEDVDALYETAKVSSEEKDVLERLRKGCASFKKNPDGSADLLAFQGLRVRMAIHMGNSDGGIKGASCRFVHHLTDLSWGGMILLSEPAVKDLAGVLDQLGNSVSTIKESVNIPKLVSMGVHTFEDYHDPQEMFHIFNEPLRGRHMMWDAKSLQLRDSSQHALGFYDAPVNREGIQEDACIMFGDVENTPMIQKLSAKVFTEAIRDLHAALGPVLLKHRGYNVPQREGHFMFAFKDPLSAVYFHRDFQAALLAVKWPEKLNELPVTAPTYAENDSKTLIFSGLTVCLGMSFGPLAKQLENGRANYTGPTANRAARVCSMSRAGQLTMFEHEYKEQEKLFASAEPLPISAKVMLKEVTLKGVQGKPNVVCLNTDDITQLRQVKLSGSGGDLVPVGIGI